MIDLLAEATVENGRLAGRKLTPGAFVSPELSYDGKTILFAYTQGERPRPSTMYTCPTRGGSSGSPVILQDGRIAAVHSAGTRGTVSSAGGAQLTTNDDSPIFSELTGFAIGAPGWKAAEMVENARP